jgi:drug/metabolite transporter (DMT)-like permease
MLLPYLGLLCNAFVWGLSWWPLRELQTLGLHPLWATVVFFTLGATLILLARPQALGRVASQPALWALALAAGFTNAAFNWAVSIGDVVRVVLLFYLMPLWAVLLAWWLMDERITKGALLRVTLALLGALLVLKPAQGGWPRFDGLADWLGLLGGLGFALTNVLLRQQCHEAAASRALAMFLGGSALPLALGAVLWPLGLVSAWPEWHAPWLLGALAVGLLFFGSNLALQYGASRLPVHTTSVVMLTEIVFATLSSVWWGGATLTPTVLLGGGLILGAALLATQDTA